MSGEKTVFRPSPLAAAQGGAAGGEKTTFAAAPAAAAPSPPPPQRAWAEDDVPPVDAPMQVRNPLMAAAARLLALAAAIQADRQVSDVTSLRARAGEEARAFEKLLAGFGLSAEDNARARYGVLATVDDIVQNLPGGAQSDWARNSLVVQSFGQAFGGDQFFTILDTMLGRPAANLDMLELYHACLAVGFQGRARIEPNGREQLAARSNAIYGALSGIRPRPETDLVPNWVGRPTPMGRVGWLSRAAIVAAAVLAVLLLLFLALKLLLDSRDRPAWQALRQVPPVVQGRIDRIGGDVAVAESGQLQRIRSRLTNSCIQANDDGANIRLVVAACPGLPGGMFERGAATLDEAYAPLIREAASALRPEPGPVTVVAHTDSDPIRGALAATFPDNLTLSQARAAAVAGLVDEAVGDPDRVSVEGRGDREPVDRSDTDEAKAKNRRVELVLPRSE